MDANNNFSINSLDYPAIRENLITFLQSQKTINGTPVYQDYNFVGSGISTLVNLLAYHTHYLGYYVKMMLNESFIDSAIKRETLLSKAKLTGYVPKSNTCAKMELQLQLTCHIGDGNTTDQRPSSGAILIPKGTSFIGANAKNDQRTFFTIEDVFIKNVEIIETVSPKVAVYTSDVITVYEGQFKVWQTQIDTNLLNQRYIIKDDKIDVDTMSVLVANENNTDAITYELASNVFDIEKNKKVYFLSTNEDTYYEVVFGNGVFGEQPIHKSRVNIYYMSSNGESGNGCKRLVFNRPNTDEIPLEHTIGNWEDYKVILADNAVSTGGAEAETIDSLRFTIPHHNSRQNRIVTKEDFKSILLSEFRNIDAINVWGGEDNYQKDFGKIYIAIKPKCADSLSTTAKKRIISKLIDKYCVIGTQPVIVDPEFINVNLTVVAKLDLSKTTKTIGQIEREIVNVITEFNNTKLNTFGNDLSEAYLMRLIMDTNDAIKSCFSTKLLNKTQTITYNNNTTYTMYLIPDILHGIKSYSFSLGVNSYHYEDNIKGQLVMVNDLTNEVAADTYGNIDYKKGIIYFTFPNYATMNVYNHGTTGLMGFDVVATYPDIETYLQNIIRIANIKVKINV